MATQKDSRTLEHAESQDKGLGRKGGKAKTCGTRAPTHPGMLTIKGGDFYAAITKTTVDSDKVSLDPVVDKKLSPVAINPGARGRRS